MIGAKGGILKMSFKKSLDLFQVEPNILQPRRIQENDYWLPTQKVKPKYQYMPSLIFTLGVAVDVDFFEELYGILRHKQPIFVPQYGTST